MNPGSFRQIVRTHARAILDGEYLAKAMTHQAQMLFIA
jgi:hypothetical protein